MKPPAPRIEGRLYQISRHAKISGVEIWFAYRTTEDSLHNLTTTTDTSGEFSFEVPTATLKSAHIGATLEGVAPIDLEPNGAALQPGELVLVVDDALPSYLRYAG